MKWKKRREREDGICNLKPENNCVIELLTFDAAAYDIAKVGNLALNL